jgi:hypothetical protein
VRGHAASDGPGLRERADAVVDAFTELLDREFAPSAGHLTALLSGCVFAPSLRSGSSTVSSTSPPCS